MVETSVPSKKLLARW